MGNKDTTLPSGFKRTNLSLGIRTLVGAYVAYTGFGLFPSWSIHEGTERIVIIVFTILFILLGIMIAGCCIYWFLKGEYSGGKADKIYWEAVEEQTQSEKYKEKNEKKKCEEKEKSETVEENRDSR